MSQKNTQILNEISQLIASVESSEIQKNDKLKIVKVLLAIKLKLIWLLEEDLKKEAKMMYLASPVRIIARAQKRESRRDLGEATSNGASVAKSDVTGNAGNSVKISDKHELIIQFIKQNSGRVSATKLLDLGIAGRSLRRYIKNLSASGKISVEKKGREHFYSIII